jgi:hypothetical protein
MLYEYKIQKIEDGNGVITYNVQYYEILKTKRNQKKNWRDLNNGVFDSLKEAQDKVKAEITADNRVIYERKSKEKTVLKEYVYTDIPNHIPEEQGESFCDKKGATL